MRELISNAADALDKLRFLSVKNPEILGSNTELAIRIEINTEEKTVSVTDSGIGNIQLLRRANYKIWVQLLNQEQLNLLRLLREEM